MAATSVPRPSLSEINQMNKVTLRETLKEILAGLETSTRRSDDCDINTMLHQV